MVESNVNSNKPDMQLSKLLFSILVAVYPIFIRYASLIPYITLAETGLLAFWVFHMFKAHGRIKIYAATTLLCAFLLIDVVMALVGNSAIDPVDSAGTALRLIFLYASIAILSQEYFDFEIGYKAFRIVGFILSVYAIIQTVAAFTGRYLSTYLPFLPIMGTQNIDNDILYRASYGIQFRPCSLLNEPSDLAVYLILVIFLLLFYRRGKRETAIAIFHTLVCFISRSSTGIILCLLIWCLYFARFRSLNKSQIVNRMVGMVAGAVGATFVLIRTGIWQYFVDRTFQGNLSIGGLSTSTRFYAIQKMFESSGTLKGLLFGAGLATTEDYLPGFARIFYCMGLLGLIVFFVYLIAAYRKGSQRQKLLLVLFAFLNIGTEIILGRYAMVYLSVIEADDGMGQEITVLNQDK